MQDRPFKVLGIQQIALGSSDRNQLRKLWVELLGGESIGVHRAESENVDEEILKLGEGARSFEVDLMQSLDPSRKPRLDSPPLHHVGLWIDDLKAAYEWLGQKGVRFAPGGIRKGAAGHDVCFIHPKANEDFPVGGGGALLELVQAPADVIGR
jgi:lactoylglutathione lyase